MKVSPLQQLLAIFLAFIMSMLLCRILYSGTLRFIFLLWNLFLAWLPFQLSVYFPDKKSAAHWYTWVLLAAWLLFFPNALYITTDLIHLQSKTTVPAWYDAILLFTAATMGLIMAFASLYRAELFFKRQFSRAGATKLVFACLFFGSFGVYLGRFLRWNSWDIVSHPFQLAGEISVRFYFPGIIITPGRLLCC